MKELRIRVTYEDYKNYQSLENCKKVENGYNAETKTIDLMMTESQMTVYMVLQHNVPQMIADGTTHFGYQIGFEALETTFTAQPDSNDKTAVMNAIKVAKQS